ncbi:MAG: addiction module toxin, HicA family [Candidatus Lloydbacteria bacterium RIFCSPHIGHO2_01_FULL_41_20]|uniref:Addiction module toxin, HicA family n=1 Tax=Candidatus Lloydbacteria bacterium RIFCSPHIGHO2_01_FULL_41_20 TaxID=1798657 RepID=A0A1G2CRK4_9BACT|nr:MAG: addiction module toxin, HicA family [Candidatus Lloydbacteria bacterium RIFCSPHIGHO2_01_FULL_41_20]
MKRIALVKFLLKHGCVFVREGGKHSVYFNPATKRTSTVPRHTEINDFLARKICRDLGIAEL